MARRAAARTVSDCSFDETLRQAEHLFQSLLNQYFGEEN
jgi:hypothetical protein